MSIKIGNNRIGETVLVNAPEKEITEVLYEGVSYNEANNTLTADPLGTVTLEEDTIYLLKVTAEDFPIDSRSKVYLTDYQITLENVYEYFNQVTREFEIHIVLVDDSIETKDSVKHIVDIAPGGGGGGKVQPIKYITIDTVSKTILPDSPNTSMAKVEATIAIDPDNEITPTSQDQTVYPANGTFFAFVTVKGLPDWDGVIV